MEHTDQIALMPLSGPDEETRSELSIGGRATGTFVAGRVLEAALRCAQGWLLFATSDTPSEEMLAVHLVDHDGQPLDSANIGGPYATGSFSALRLEPPATVHFRFIDDAEWSVEVLETPRFAVPYVPDARGVWRGAGVRRHFVVRRDPD